MNEYFANPVLFVLLGIAIIWTISAFRKLFDAVRSSSWPTADGTIAASGISESEDLYGRRDLRLIFSFEYSVDGTDYSNDRVSFSLLEVSDYSPLGTGKDAMEAITSRYPLGAAVKVYYDELEPKNSVLEPRTGAISNLLLGILGLGTIGLLIRFGFSG